MIVAKKTIIRLKNKVKTEGGVVLINPLLDSNVKDTELIKKRRKQMIDGALTLFKEKGFHRTTTREIAKESGFSIGTLYEYIRSKEDILFLVYEQIFSRVYNHLKQVTDLEKPSIDNLISVVESYFRLMHEMQDEVIILYQEGKSLERETRNYILQKEREMVNLLKEVIEASTSNLMSEQDAELLANNLFALGQMWCFRRWVLHKQFTIDEYIERQIHFLLKTIGTNGEISENNSK